MSQRVKTSARGLVLPRSSSPENGHLRKNFLAYPGSRVRQATRRFLNLFKVVK